MPTRFPYICSFVVGFILLQSACVGYADTCYKYHKRAPVKSVCGRITNTLGQRPDGIELTLVTESGSVFASAQVDNQGKFAFVPVPKGDYTLRATAPGYRTEERQVSVTHDRTKSCKPNIDVKLGFTTCQGGTYIRGVDKKSDLGQ